MSFLYPSFLFALAAVALPVIIHLFYFRRFRKVYFSNVRFLREVKEETSMRSRLRNLLVLLLRCLAVACLVVAFAQPFIPLSEGILKGRKAVSVYVDNSFSMGAEGDRAALLQLAKDRAVEVVSAYGPEDRFQVLTNTFSGRSQQLIGQEAAVAAIEEIEVGPESRRLSRVLDRQRSALLESDAENRLAYLLSDFQRNVTDLTAVDTTLRVSLLPLRAVQQRNVAIDSVWLEAPVAQVGVNNLLLVRIRNYSEERLDNVRLSITYADQTKPEGTLSLPPNDYVVDSVYLQVAQGGTQRARLSVTDYPVEFDDDYFITFRTTERVSVLNISPGGQPSPNLGAALRLDVFSPTFVDVRSIDYGRMGDYGLVVVEGLPTIASGLSEQLRQYVNGGGNLLVFPPAQADLDGYNSLLASLPADELRAYEEQEREVGRINEEEFVFNDVFDLREEAIQLPSTQANFPLTRYGSRGQRRLLTYRDGSTALATYRIGRGNLYLSAAPIDPAVNTLSRNAEIFVPMLYKMGISTGDRRPLAYTIGRDESIETARRRTSGDLVYRLSGSAGEFIPRQRTVGNQVALGLSSQLPEAGIYDLLLGDSTITAFAFNYDRIESDLRYTGIDELEDVEGVDVLTTENEAALAADIREANEGRPLWRIFIWLTLAFLLAEVLVLRFWEV